MSIFKHSAGDAQQTTTAAAQEPAVEAGPPEQAARLLPPFVAPATPPRAAAAPGVLPPPAAPMYSMRPPETPARAEPEAERAAPESPKAASAPQSAQASVPDRSRAAAPRLQPTPTSPNGARRRPAPPTSTPPLASPAHYPFDPVAAAQAGLLNLAWSWQEAGAPIRAIHTYMELLARHPGTPAAAAAVADLVQLSNKLAQQGNFHIALSIYEEMEHLHQMQEEE